MKADAKDLPPPARALIAPEPAEAVTALYRAHALGLIRLAVVMLGDRGAAEDAVQEAFCGLYRRWHGLSDPGKALSYLRSSVINGCRSALRRRRRRASLDPSTGDAPGESAEATALIGEPTESPAVAVVHDTVSGETLATIKPSIRGGTIRAVSAAGDDRTFLLDEQTWAKFLPHVAVTEYAGPHTFYLLRLSSAGRVSSLTRLRVTVPATQVLAAFALSPDAQRLALVVQARKHSQGRTDLEVVTLSTGSTRVWAAVSGFFRSGAGDSRGLSWTADGRELAFEWQPNNVGQWPGVEARLLNLTSADGDLMAASRRIIATTRQFTPSGSTFQVADAENEPVVTPDGSAIVTNTVYFQVKTKESGQATNGRYGFAEYSTRTGKLVRILGYWKIKPAGYFFTQVLWSSPSGRVLIGVIPDGRIGVINGNEFTPLNMPPVPSVVMDIGLGAQAGAW